MAEEITARQREVLQAIHTLTVEEGRAPTIRELGDALGIASTNGVATFLHVLEKKGALERGEPNTSRGMKLTPFGLQVIGARRCEGCGRPL